MIAVVIVVGFVIVIFTDSEKAVPVHYLIAGKDKLPVRVEECPDRVSEEFKRMTSKRSRSVDVTLCFKFPETVNPPAVKKPNPVDIFNLSTARPVDWDAALEAHGGLSLDYMSRVRDSFQIPEADEDHIIRLGWTQTLKNAGLYILGMLASLAFF